MDSKELVALMERSARNAFSGSIFPVYQFGLGRLPIHVGSAFAIEHLGRKFVVTAAHVLDQRGNGELALGTGEQDQVVLVKGKWIVSDIGAGDRQDDPIDLALHEVTSDEISNYKFIPSALIESSSQVAGGKRVMTIIGFPVSKNKKISPSGRIQKKLSPTRAQYTEMESSPGAYFKERGMSERTHVAMSREKRSLDSNGLEVNTIGHHGLSGGPMVSISFSNADYTSFEHKVVGVVLEGSETHKVVVALRMSEVLIRIEMLINNNFDNPVD